MKRAIQTNVSFAMWLGILLVGAPYGLDSAEPKSPAPISTSTNALPSISAATDDLNEQIELLQEVIAKLELQNEHLRAENQQLRRWLSESNRVAHVTPLANVATTDLTAGKSKPEAGTTSEHWLTTSSGIRHNGQCRYFETTAGRPSNADEGTPCKICGG